MLPLREVLTPDSLLEQVRARYSGLVQTTTWGERVLFYNPQGAMPRGVHFVSLKERDSAHDATSRLDETGGFRLSFAVSAKRYHALFGVTPESHAEATTAQPIDELAPHPVFGWLSWAAIINPSGSSLERLWPVLDESYALAQEKHAARTADQYGSIVEIRCDPP